MIKERSLIGLAVIAVLAACGGGGGGSSVPTTIANSVGGAAATSAPAANATSSAIPAGDVVASMTVTLAKGTFATSSTARRGAQTIGPGTESIVFTLLQQNGASASGTPQTFGLTSVSPGCTVNATTGALGCTLPVDAPIGEDVFLAQTYTNSDGTGSLTGSGAVALDVGVNTTNTATIVLNGQVASAYVVSADPYLGNVNTQSKSRAAALARTRVINQGSYPVYSSSQLFVIATDSSGNVILNPSTYSSPIYLQMFFDSGYTADTVMNVTYAANDPAPCTSGGTASASGWYGSFPICSPADAITVSLAPTGGIEPSQDAYIAAFLSASSLTPTPAPSASPNPLPSEPTTNSFADIYIVYPTSGISVGVQ